MDRLRGFSGAGSYVVGVVIGCKVRDCFAVEAALAGSAHWCALGDVITVGDVTWRQCPG
jgi:hypothetical protein